MAAATAHPANISSNNLAWRQTNHLLLRRGPYVIAAGLDESVEGAPKRLRGRLLWVRFTNAAQPRELRLQF